MPCQQWRNGIADLIEPAGFSTTKFKPIGKRLQSGGFMDQQASAATVRQADAVHIPRRASKISTGQCARRKIRIKITRPRAKRSALIFCNVFIHARRKKLGFWRGLKHQLTQRFTSRKLVWFFRKKLKLTAMSDDNYAFAILRHAIINSIDKTNLNDVVQRLQSSEYLFKIPAVAVEDTPDIFKNPNLRLNLLHG